jgi:FtsZ-interacting cell division protein ZipA
VGHAKEQCIERCYRGIAASLVPTFEGPFRLSRKISDNVFELEDEDGVYICTRNVDQLRRFHRPPDWVSAPVEEEQSESSDEEMVEENPQEPPVQPPLDQPEDKVEEQPQEPPATPPSPDQTLRDRPQETQRPRRNVNPPTRFRDFIMAFLD